MLTRSNPFASFHSFLSSTLRRRPLAALLAAGALLATNGCSGAFTVQQEPLAAGAATDVAIPTTATSIDHVVSSDDAVASVTSVSQTSAQVTAGVPGSATLTGYDASNRVLGQQSVTVAATASIGHDGWINDGVTVITGEPFNVHAITLDSNGGTLEGDGAIRFALGGSLASYQGWNTDICLGDCVAFQASSPGDGEVVMTAASSSAISTLHVHTVSAIDTFTIASSSVKVSTGNSQSVTFATSAAGVAVLTNPTCSADSTAVQATSYEGSIQVSALHAGTANVTCTEAGRTVTIKVTAS
jgi:hypothetical protein